jgi:hypothetical protein
MTAPNLRKMILADWHFEFSPPAPAISWPHITHYSGALTADSQVAILRAAPNLLSCAIVFPHVVDFDPGIPASFYRNAGISSPSQAPVLQELFCQDSNGRSEILPFIQSWSRSLKLLVLVICSVDFELITILRGLLSLAHLIIEDDGNYSKSSALFDALSSDLCLNLASLVYGYAFALPKTTFLPWQDLGSN